MEAPAGQSEHLDQELLRDVALSGVELHDPRLSYVTVQIDARLWAQLQERFNLRAEPAPADSQ